MKRKLITSALFIASIMGAFFIGKSQAKTEVITKTVEVEKEVIPENYIDLREIVDFKSIETCHGIYLYTKDGNYYWGE